MGGREVFVLVDVVFVVVEPPRAYMNCEAAQSSSNMGSSSPSDFKRGRRVARRARCVVRLRSGRGYERGGEMSMIWIFRVC